MCVGVGVGVGVWGEGKVGHIFRCTIVTRLFVPVHLSAGCVKCLGMFRYCGWGVCTYVHVVY